jgi:D-tagatose-1,6-bisphosphate aldolase subunit GatZ/KbaZ
MLQLKAFVRKMISWRESQERRVTLLAVCPSSPAVLEAAVRCASLYNIPMLLNVSLNQVDRDGGYSGWTPGDFVYQIYNFAARYAWHGPLYPCLDHLGQWLKDSHVRDNLSYEQTLAEVKESLSVCIQAGYQLLHIDTSVDRRLPPLTPIAIERMSPRTIELIQYAEEVRTRCELAPVTYQVGSEEVHSGLTDFYKYQAFVGSLRANMTDLKLMDAWPSFFVAHVGGTSFTRGFNPGIANQFYTLLSRAGSLASAHHADWSDSPEGYALSSVGAAKIGAELTSEEVHVLMEFCDSESGLLQGNPQLVPSNFLETLEQAVIASQHWKKWLLPNEKGKEFSGLDLKRQAWLIEVGARYIWADAQVVAARKTLYENLAVLMSDPQSYVVDRLVALMEKYVHAFNLPDLLDKVGVAED